MTNYKVFIKMIGLEDPKKCLALIKLEEDQRDVFIFCKAEQTSEAFGHKADTSWYIWR